MKSEQNARAHPGCNGGTKQYKQNNFWKARRDKKKVEHGVDKRLKGGGRRSEEGPISKETLVTFSVTNGGEAAGAFWGLLGQIGPVGSV